jgi:predicted amidohydrolase
VQFEVTEETFVSEATFRASVARQVERAVAEGSELVVFPEYSGVFLAALPYGDEVAESNTVRGALRRISQESGRPISLKSIFLDAAPAVSARMDRVFGGLAAKHEVYILGGTYFEASRTDSGERRLTNRAVVYGPAGGRVYEQDKVFLTPFERELIGLNPGSIRGADGFSLDGVSVGITICRDTFFEIWNPVHEDRHVWIDIKADGVSYDEVARRRYLATIPERLAETDVPFGVTVSLVGTYLELFWEGRTSMVSWDGGELDLLDRSDFVRRAEVVVESFRVP